MKSIDVVLPVIYRLPTSLSRRMIFLVVYGKLPRVRNPVTFHEKMNWRILKDRRELLAWTCDKLAMKDYVLSSQVGKDGGVRLPATLWTGTDVRELANVKLPDHWVLKPNHRSGGEIFFGHGQPDIADLARTAQRWLRSFEVSSLHEWAYSQARTSLLVEELIGEPGAPLPDYKFYVFGGEVAALVVHRDRHTDHCVRWYRPDWTPIAMDIVNYKMGRVEPTPPAGLEKMTAIASELGRPFDFMRIDLYSVENDVFFGELTPYPASGTDRFAPDSFDDELGAMWELPKALRLHGVSWLPFGSVGLIRVKVRGGTLTLRQLEEDIECLLVRYF